MIVEDRRSAALLLRHVAQHKIHIHPLWGPAHRAILHNAFDLEDDELDALHMLLMWIADHGLEKAWGVREEIRER